MTLEKLPVSNFVNPFPFRTWLDSVLEAVQEEYGHDEYFFEVGDSEWEKQFNKGMSSEDAVEWLTESWLDE